MPNYRAVSAGEIPQARTSKEALKIATKNNFDSSAFLFADFTTLMAEGANRHPQFGKGPAGFGRYYWRGLVDRTDGNYLVIFALPTLSARTSGTTRKAKGGALGRPRHSASDLDRVLPRRGQYRSSYRCPVWMGHRPRRPHQRLPRIVAGHRRTRSPSEAVMGPTNRPVFS
jgi:hypothetical protein